MIFSFLFSKILRFDDRHQFTLIPKLEGLVQSSKEDLIFQQKFYAYKRQRPSPLDTFPCHENIQHV